MKKYILFIILILFTSALSATGTFLFMNNQLSGVNEECRQKKLELEDFAIKAKEEATQLQDDINKLEEKTKTTLNDYPDSQNGILYFYSPSCSVCQKQGPIVKELENESVKFIYMNVQTNPEYISEYNIIGTPTFIYKNNKVSGYQTKEGLKDFWDSNN